MIRTQKWVFEGQTRPNKNLDLRDQIGLIWGEEQTVKAKKRRGRGRRRREEEEEGIKPKKVWKLNLCMDSMRLCMNFHAWLVRSCPQTWGFARVSS